MFADDSTQDGGPLFAVAAGTDGRTPSAPGNYRRSLLIHLAEDLRAAIAAGDLEAARMTHEFIGRILGNATTQVALVTSFTSEHSDAEAGR